jgi:hypothetical protein
MHWLFYIDVYIHSPIRIHGVVFNSLSSGTTLLYNAQFLGFSEHTWTEDVQPRHVK